MQNNSRGFVDPCLNGSKQFWRHAHLILCLQFVNLTKSYFLRSSFLSHSKFSHAHIIKIYDFIMFSQREHSGLAVSAIDTCYIIILATGPQANKVCILLKLTTDGAVLNL